MKRAHSRVVLAMGGEVAFAEMLERLPLSPQDHDIINLSTEVAGWSDDLMARPKAKAKAKANAAGSPAAPPVASSRIGLALHRRPQPRGPIGFEKGSRRPNATYGRGNRIWPWKLFHALAILKLMADMP